MTNTVKRYLLTGSVKDRPRSGWLSILQQEHVEFIDERMSENDELTTRDLAKLIRNVNMQKMLIRSKDQVDKKEQLDNVIFSDESSVQIERQSRQCYHKKGQPRKLKHPLKVHVWTGISKRRATKVVIFDGKRIATACISTLKF